MDEQSWLFKKYTDDWNAVALPGHYEQPEGQGLQAKSLKLVAQPIQNGTAPGPSKTVSIVREIYERIYGIADVERDDLFVGRNELR